AAKRLAEELEGDGFPVTRVKIEASPLNRDVPIADSDAAKHPPERYFEHHVKLLLAGDAELVALTAIAQRHAAHVSRNALRTRDDGRQERLVAQRCPRVR